MPEPITIGAFVVGVLVKIAEAGVAELTKGAAREAYVALKSKVAEWVGAKVEVLEAAPDSEKLRREIAEAVNGQDAESQTLANSLAQAVIEKEANDKGRAFALDFADLKNVTVTIKEITATGNATGARMTGVEGGVINVNKAKAEGGSPK